MSCHYCSLVNTGIFASSPTIIPVDTPREEVFLLFSCPYPSASNVLPKYIADQEKRSMDTIHFLCSNIVMLLLLADNVSVCLFYGNNVAKHVEFQEGLLFRVRPQHSKSSSNN